MRAPPIRRLVTVLSVLALLLAGFAAASVAADALCGADMALAAASGPPCDGHDMPPDPEKASSSAACFAKCPAPLIARAPAPFVLTYVQLPAQAPRHSALVGVGVAPPLEPPRV